jgi:lipoprotein-anchoring transpeptidase ErfK/SrfK
MSTRGKVTIDRRSFLASGAAAAGGLLAVPALAQDTNAGSTEIERDLSEVVRRNISSFRSLDWQPYFSNTRNGAILVDTTSRALHFWSEDQSIYKLYPTSVPLSEELTRLGRTSVVQKVEGPDWRPTPSMLQRNPEWPAYIPPGPDNPLGTHALYLSWTYYRIHGTHDTRKIGRRSSNGCIGLYNEHIKELFGLAQVGSQVLLI